LFNLTVYLSTTAPSVTFWDAGEFIATSYSLGIPHPPGTPLFVLLGRVWTLIVPYLSVAFEMNLLSALCGAISSAFLYLVVSRILRAWIGDDNDMSAQIVVHGGGISAAISSSYLITVWENTTETEVYVLALLTISLFSWLTLRWHERLSWNKRTNVIVLMSFIAGLSVGNHLMALLIGPSLILFILMTDWRSLINAKTLLAVVIFFFLGLTIHIYLPVRAALNPSINEADPSSWQAFWEVLARKQYGSRSMFVRTADFFRYQIPLYFIYFRDQFGSDLLVWPLSGVGLIGMWEHFRRERRSFVFFFLLFMLTSLGLVLYLNFRIGHSQALDEVPNPQMHEVRERDYFFIVSFVIFGLWIGMGLASVFNVVRSNISQRIRENRGLLFGLGVIVFLPSFIPMYMNYDRADRSGNYIAYDYAYNIIQSVEPYGVIFTNGDNDTFPLWFLQEVIGLRRDVIVANLSLLNTPWYIKQIRDRVLPRPEELSEETRAFLEEKEGYDLSGYYTDKPIVNLTDERIDAIFPRRLPQRYKFRAGGLTQDYAKGSVFFVKDIMVLHILETNKWERPIYFAVTVSDDNKVDLFDNLVMEGLVYRINEDRSDSLSRIRSEIVFIPETKTYIDIDRSKHLLDDVYSYRGIDDEDIYKSKNTKKLLNNYAAAYSYLGRSLLGRNELDSALACYENAYRFASGNTRFLYLLATLYAQSGQGEKADETFRDFVIDRPLDPRYLLQMASFFIRGSDSSRAAKYLEEAIVENPNMKEAYQMLARIYEKGKEPDKAGEVRRKWIAGHPGDSLK
jgi:tetratricopeptide (TPR) repeat protein